MCGKVVGICVSACDDVLFGFEYAAWEMMARCCSLFLWAVFVVWSWE